MAARIPYPGRALRPGDVRTITVRGLQHRLVEVGCGPLDTDGVFGPETLAAVKLFQTRRGLVPDGVVGPVTWAILFALPEPVVSEPRSTLLRGVLAVAREQVGVREEGGPNRGPMVEKYLASVGLAPGNAWCMAFAYYCHEKSAEALRIPNPAVRTGGVLRHWESAPGNFKIPGDDIETLPSPGAIFCIDHGHGRGHCGIVLAVRESIVMSIEGNGLPLDAPVLTPGGFVEIGNLVVGDTVCDPAGGTDGTSKVTGVFPQGVRDVFELVFQDGTRVVADADHRWLLHTGKSDGPTDVLRTVDVYETENRGDSGPGGRLFLPATAPVEFPHADLPLDPYLLGLLLGDGGLSRPGSVRFTNSEADLVAAAGKALPRGAVMKHIERDDYRFTGGVVEITRSLGLEGSLSFTKHVPRQYLYASIEQRLALLQGLLDTDGTADGYGRVSFCSTSRQLAEDVQFLVQSLGGKVRISERTNIFYTSPNQPTRKQARDAFLLRNIRFKAGNEFPLFRLKRKQERVGLHHPFGLRRGWGIKEVLPCGRTETVCIAVSAPSRLYMTRGLVPTHNTNASGGREGDGVYRRQRQRTEINLGYLDYSR